MSGVWGWGSGWKGCVDSGRGEAGCGAPGLSGGWRADGEVEEGRQPPQAASRARSEAERARPSPPLLGQPCGRPAGGAGAGLSSGGCSATAASTRTAGARKCPLSLPSPLLRRTAAAAAQMEWKMAIGRQ